MRFHDVENLRADSRARDAIRRSHVRAPRELVAEWHGPTDQYALDHLFERGFILADDHWIVPPGAALKDARAIAFSHLEWGYPNATKPAREIVPPLARRH